MKNENRFYVYVHRLKETGEIFYIGKGAGHRMTSKHGRGRLWKSVVEKNEWYAEIHTNNLTSEEACVLEVELIAELKPEGNKQKKDISARKINYQDFEDLYYYDPTSPSGLRYVSGNRQSDYRKRVAGDVAGTLLKSGYFSVHYKSSNYAAHRVIWCLVNKCIIGKELVDHIDRDRSNNRIENLRLVTSSQNNKNIPIKSHNKTGFTGVSYSKDANLYIAHWTDTERKAYNKSFSASKYGNDLSLALAVEYRHRQANKVNGYIENQEYERLLPLRNLSEQEIEKLFSCDLLSTNNSGVSRVHFSTVRNNSFWNYSGGEKTVRFSCTKHGEDKARDLAIEYKNFIENSLSIESVSVDLQKELNNPTRAGNLSGFRNISFVGENKDVILVQVMIDYKNNTKRFDTVEMGLLPAMTAAVQWRDTMKSKTNGGSLGT